MSLVFVRFTLLGGVRSVLLSFCMYMLCMCVFVCGRGGCCFTNVKDVLSISYGNIFLNVFQTGCQQAASQSKQPVALRYLIMQQVSTDLELYIIFLCKKVIFILFTLILCVLCMGRGITSAENCNANSCGVYVWTNIDQTYHLIPITCYCCYL